MFNATVTAIPGYMVMARLGWIDTYWSIIIPAFGSTLGLYLMKGFIAELPDTLFEAARIDGASEFTIFWKIVMPNVKAAWLTLVIFSVQNLWNANNGTYIYSEQLKTMPYAISQITSSGIANKYALQRRHNDRPHHGVRHRPEQRHPDNGDVRESRNKEDGRCVKFLFALFTVFLCIALAIPLSRLRPCGRITTTPRDSGCQPHALFLL